ncbi:hypothetical protein [Paraferrimonas sedimenticola]|uniref:Uncharacterized protein n=1 Tax=Paraferrimonas sedimenticola TaxID=375674 RepID=A0AA37RTG9_9GAMM|nr:hypothetical protein [Paraferrimonas sedimenticola]GLP95326.1 hypothetical protein GCM10007895_06320 [Paraferrimonas sedimenticola]
MTPNNRQKIIKALKAHNLKALIPIFEAEDSLRSLTIVERETILKAKESLASWPQEEELRSTAWLKQKLRESVNKARLESVHANQLHPIAVGNCVLVPHVDKGYALPGGGYTTDHLQAVKIATRLSLMMRHCKPFTFRIPTKGAA